MKEAAIEAKQGGERGITARSVKKVTAVSKIMSDVLWVLLGRSGSSRDRP